jgi:amidohydrolase
MARSERPGGVLLWIWIGLAVLSPAPGAAAAPGPGPRPDFHALAAVAAEEAIADRRWLHAHPELALREHATRAFLRERLLAIPGVELVEGSWETGIVALLRGARAAPLVAYRADIDALPLTEATGLPFASTARDTLGGREVGVMHACGHDLHAAMLLGLVRVLAGVRDRLPGSLLAVLEPAEEIGAGAPLLLAAGLFAGGRRPEAVFALHDHPTLPFGQVGYCPGRSSANVDDFRIRVIGKGGHAAYPHRAIDPVVIAAQMVIAFQSIVSREVDAARQAVITVGSIHGGTTSNVIPDAVDLHGTVRTLEPAVRSQVEAAVKRAARATAAAAGAAEPEIAYRLGTPSMMNDPALMESLRPVLERVAGRENVVRYEPALGGEDFAYYQEVVPGALFRLGVGRPDREMDLHSPTFDPDERAIPLGIELAAEIVWDRLARAASP